MVIHGGFTNDESLRIGSPRGPSHPVRPLLAAHAVLNLELPGRFFFNPQDVLVNWDGHFKSSTYMLASHIHCQS